MNFTYSDLKNFLLHCKSLGDVIPFCEYSIGSKAIILRHDVDFNVDCAYSVAKIEEECGLRSTFLFMTTSHTYNILSACNRKKIKEMSDLGFEIGLHFDPTIYQEENVDVLEGFAKKEALIISDVTGVKVKSVSVHYPSIHGRYPMFKSFINAYDPMFFDDSKYISDSRFLFCEKDLYKFVEKVKESIVQVLLHPMHYSEKRKTYPEVIKDYILRETFRIDKEMQLNSTYNEQIEGKDLIKYLFKGIDV